MKRRQRLPELLAPAGDMEALYAAISAGADAVYIGGKRFGARAFAKNFDDDELKLAVRLCHAHGVRLFVTVNTLIFDREMNELMEYVGSLAAIGVDALIVSDLGAAALVKERFPDLELHASTQASAHNSEAVELLSSLGFSRVVLARECTGEDIREITEKTSVETEVFVHGAICVCHSGQCLFSSLVGGRSGNLGECAQPCRLPYNGGYPLSIRDMGLYSHIDELIASGVASLKIEGRMKSAGYVYTVTSIYRRLLDEGRGANGAEIAELLRAFSRGDFTDGYFTARLGNMTGVRTDDDKRLSLEISQRGFDLPRMPISAVARLSLGEPSELTLVLDKRKHRDKITVSAKGAIPEAARSAPLSWDSLANRLSRLGNTVYSLTDRAISLTLDRGINLPPSLINALRREAAEMLDKELMKPLSKAKTPKCDNKYLQKCDNMQNKELKTAVFLKDELLRFALDKGAEILSDFDIVFAPLFFDSKRIVGCGLSVYLPPVIMERELDAVKARLAELCETGVKYALVSNISHIPLCQAAGLSMIGDFRLNITNGESYRLFRSLGVSSSVLSAELTLPQARDIGGGEIVYGRIPLMLTERCFIKETFSCLEREGAALTDRRGARFPIICEWGHRNLILNSKITYMGDRLSDIRASRIRHLHFIFTTEAPSELLSNMAAFSRGESLENSRRIGKNR